MSNIGVAISTRNRREMTEHSIAEWKKYLPEDSKLVIVDDASDVPYPYSSFRFDERAGIAVVKNKCLELLDDCEHIFLADDDIYPQHMSWWIDYVRGPLSHACYVFNRKKLWSEPDYTAYELPRGCLLYFTKRCIQIAGGFDTQFTSMYEHAELSRRIFNMKLTPARYVDIPNSQNTFYSHDEQFTAKSSISQRQRNNYINANKKRFEETALSNSFKPYK